LTQYLLGILLVLMIPTALYALVRDGADALAHGGLLALLPLHLAKFTLLALWMKSLLATRNGSRLARRWAIAAVAAVLVGYCCQLAYPPPHQVAMFALQSDAERGGATLAHLFAIIGLLLLIWRVGFGRAARRYFALAAKASNEAAEAAHIA
jgi:hypothetical protein